MTIQDIIQAIHASPLSAAIRHSGSAFPWLESLHVLAITTVLGTIAIVDLRLIGFASHRRSARRLIIDMLPFTWMAFVVAVVTGGLMFASNAKMYAANGPFLWKMVALVAAGINMAIFHLGAYRRIDQWHEDTPPALGARVAGVSSLGLWVTVVVLGRWIGFVF